MVPIVIILLVVIIAIIALVSVGRAIFSGFNPDETTQVDQSQQNLLSTSTDRGVRLEVRGPIVANEDFRTYRLEVTPSSRQLTVYSGYQDRELDSINLSNSVRAYEQFVYALDKANMMRGEALADDEDDLRGICATGLVHKFAVLDSGEPTKQLWTSDCKGSAGSLKANLKQLTSLFLKQVPDGDDLIRKHKLS